MRKKVKKWHETKSYGQRGNTDRKKVGKKRAEKQYQQVYIK